MAQKAWPPGLGDRLALPASNKPGKAGEKQKPPGDRLHYLFVVALPDTCDIEKEGRASLISPPRCHENSLTVTCRRKGTLEVLVFVSNQGRERRGFGTRGLGGGGCKVMGVGSPRELGAACE